MLLAGKYKGKTGTFLRLAGQASACVKLDGDTVAERTIRLSSIRPEGEESVEDDGDYLYVLKED